MRSLKSATPAAPLGGRVRDRKGLAGAKAGGDVGGEPRRALDLEQARDALGQRLRVAIVIRDRRLIALGDDLQLALGGEDDAGELGRARRTRDGGSIASQRSIVSTILRAGRRAPIAIGVGDRAQQVAVEAVVAAMMREIIFDRPVGQAHQRAHHRARCWRDRPAAAIASPRRAQAWRYSIAPVSPRRRLRHCTSPISASSPRSSASAIKSARVRRTSSCSARPSIGWKPGGDVGLRREGRRAAIGRRRGWSGS